jgi:uncharacterized protein YjbI with pentapeptide repeats
LKIIQDLKCKPWAAKSEMNVTVYTSKMVKIDWSEFPRDTKCVRLRGKGITEMNWENAPPNLTVVDLYDNQIKEMNWDHAPLNLKTVNLNYNRITHINWDHAPLNLKTVNLNYNRITHINWDHAPQQLIKVDLQFNQIREMNWVNVPQQLTEVDLSWNTHVYCDNARANIWINEMNWNRALRLNGLTEINWKNVPNTLEPSRLDSVGGIRFFRVIGYHQEFAKYKAARRIQRAYIRHYTRRKVAATKIVNGCHNWVWKPVCKDGTIGIRPRLDILELGLTN